MLQHRNSPVAAAAVIATPLQQGMVFHHLRDTESGVDIEQLTIRSRRRLDAARVAAAFDALVRDNEILRAEFDWESGDQALMHIRDSVSIVVETHDVGSAEAMRECIDAHLADERRRGFDLSKGPLMRVALFHADDASVLCWTFHHALLDGRSFAPLLEDLFLYYEDPKYHPAPRPGFTDYAAWLAGLDFGDNLAWWREYLSGPVAPCVFPTLGGSSARSGFGFVQCRLDESATRRLELAANDLGASVNVLLQSAWAVLLQQYTNETDVVFGATYTTRHCDYPAARDIMGLMINTLPVRVRFAGDSTAGSVVRALTDHAAAVRPHVLTPLNNVQQQAEQTGDVPLFDTVVVFDRVDVHEALMRRQPGWQHLSCEYTGQTNFSLALVAYGGRQLALRLEHDYGRVDASHAEVMLDGLVNLLTGFCGDPASPVARLSPLSDDRRDALLDATPELKNPPVTCLHDLWRQSVREYGERVAIRCDADALTYAELDRLSDRVAAALVLAGVHADDKVALCMERSVGLIAGLLGILKAGGAYVPIDPAYPDSRIEYTLNDAGIGLIVTDDATATRLARFGRTLLTPSANGDAGDPPDIALTPSSLAYVIYTSGSTGDPKGVAVTHANVARLIGSTQHWYGFNAHDRWTMFHSIAFDWTVYEIWGAFANGGELTVVPFWVSRSATEFYKLLSRNRITVLCQTPSAFLNLLEVDEELNGRFPLALRHVIFGGEALDLPSLRPWIERHGDESPQLANMYGITETTVHVTYRRITRRDVQDNPGSIIGVPIPDLAVLLLNRHLEPVAPGIAGEIHVAGAGLARGYLNRPELTAERFFTATDGPLKGIRLYKSGDLARWLPDGQMVYSGRADFQVKIRGFRIELGEIEHVMAALPGVHQVAVVASRGPAGHSRLVGYYVARQVEPEAVRDAISAVLPGYMVPDRIVRLDAFPLTPNGKVDRKRLPDPGVTAVTSPYRAPGNAVQETLVDIWQQVLGQRDIGVDDNFFERGGDSILSIKLLSRARRAGIHLSARDIYRHPTIAGMASIAATGADEAPDDGSSSVAAAPFLPIQRWFAQSIGPIDHWNQSFNFRLGRRVSIDDVAQALDAVCRRHAVLTAVADVSAGTLTPGPGRVGACAISRHDLACGFDLAAPARRDAVLVVNRAVDLGASRFIAAGLLDYADGVQELCLAIHHLVIDGISWSVVVRELDEHLGAGTVPGDAARPEQHALDWARRLAANTERFANETEYWEQRRGEPGPATSTERFVHTGHCRMTRTLASLNWSSRSTVAKQSLVIAAFVSALARSFPAERHVLDLESHGRSHEAIGTDLSAAIGWFTSIYPLGVPACHRPLELLEAVHRELYGLPRLGLGFGALQSAGRLASGRNSDHLFNYMGNFSSLFSDCDTLELCPPDYGTWRDPRSPHSHPCEWIVAVDDVNLSVDTLFDEVRVGAAVIDRIAADFFAELEMLHRLAGEAALSDDKLLTGVDTWQHLQSADPRALRILPTTPIQDLYIYGGGGSADTSVEQWQLRLEGRPDAGALRDAWQMTLDSHTALCTTFPPSGRMANVQVFHERAAIEWREVECPDDAQLERARRDDLAAGIDVAAGPLHRLTLAHCDEGSHTLVWTHHHLQIDGWSWPLVLEQVHATYRNLSAGESVAADRRSDYAEYVRWVHGARPKIDRSFWQRYLQDLGNDGRLPRRVSGKSSVRSTRLVLDSAMTERLKARAVRLGITPGSLYHAAWAAVLGALLGRDRVCIGSTFSGRSAEETDFTSIVGPFVSNLPLRVATRAPDAADLARAVHDTMLGLQEKQFHSSAEIQRAAGVPWLQPMFESLVVFQNYEIDQRTFELGDTVRVSAIDMPVRTGFPVTVVVVPGTEFRIDLIYDEGGLPDGFVQEALQLLDRWLRAVAAETTPDLRTDTDYAQFVANDEQVKCKAEPPQTEAERRLLEVWRELFGLRDLGVTDSFFDLGGRSVMVPVLIARIEQEFARILPVVALFQNPTVRGLAATLSAEEPTAAALADRGQERNRRSKEAIRRIKEKRRSGRGAPSAGREP